VRDGTVVAQDGTHHEVFPVATPAAEGEALRGWVRREGASRTLELGLGYGIAALFVCEGLLLNGAADARHVTLDPYQEERFGGIALRLLEEAGVSDLVEHHREESQLALPRLVAEGRSFDLAVVDANHRFDAVLVDLVYLGRLVRPGGIIFIDDYQLRSIERAVAFFILNLGWTLEETSAEDPLHHWAVVRTAVAPDERPYDHYVEF
jgi:predicted O-methyltransferase YrrM